MNDPLIARTVTATFEDNCLVFEVCEKFTYTNRDWGRRVKSQESCSHIYATQAEIDAALAPLGYVRTTRSEP